MIVNGGEFLSSGLVIIGSQGMPRRHQRSFLKQHSLSLVAVTLLIVWIVGYRMLDPATHLGAFFGNAIADWSGSIVIILGTDLLYEVRSAESRPVKIKEHPAWRDTLHCHLSSKRDPNSARTGRRKKKRGTRADEEILCGCRRPPLHLSADEDRPAHAYPAARMAGPRR